jgi:DNA-binding response OmpR family regulator
MKSDLLLIEPDMSLAKTYARYFQKNGLAVRSCDNAQQAIDEVDKVVPSIILLELQLAGHSGYEFLYELRSYSEWQGVPVIISSFVPKQTSDLSSAILNRLGVREYLYKPNTTLAKLLYTLNRYIYANYETS